MRFRNSGLIEPMDGIEQCAQTLAGVQAQILPAAGLAIANRTRNVSYRDVEAALYRRRSLVKLWGQRATLHLYASTDWPLLHAAQSGEMSWWARRAEKQGGPDGYRATLRQLAALAEERGVISRSDLASGNVDLDDALSQWGGAFKDLAWAGIVCHAERRNGRAHFAHRSHWLPDLPWDPPTGDQANRELVRRYLHAFGPASAADVAHWRGATARDVSRHLESMGNEIAPVGQGTRLLMLREDLHLLDEDPPPDGWPARLLGRFDPTLLAHKNKGWIVDGEDYSRVWKTAGHIDATVVLGGRIAGTWRYDRGSSGLTVMIAPFASVENEQKQALCGLANQAATFFGVELVDCRWLPSAKGDSPS